MGLPQQPGHAPGQIALVQDAGPDGVIDVVVDIGDAVGKVDDAPFFGLGPLAAAVAQDPVPHLKGQVQPGAAVFQPVHHPQALLVVAEPCGERLVQRPLPCVAKGGVPQVVSQGDGLGQVFVEPQAPGDGAGDLGDLQRVGQTGAVVVALR